MNFEVPKTPGIYSLIFDVQRDMTIPVGALGGLGFSRGYYIYTGSARGQASMTLHTRLHRHLQGTKKPFWHIDYLLTSEVSTVWAVLFFKTLKDLECTLAQSIVKVPAVHAVHKGFGASDCRNRCYSHLSQFEHMDLEALMREVSDVYQTFSASYHVVSNRDLTNV